MRDKFRRNQRRQQAILKVDGQKLFKINNDGGLLSNFGGLPVVARIAQDSQLINMAAAPNSGMAQRRCCPVFAEAASVSASSARFVRLLASAGLLVLSERPGIAGSPGF